jgi:hypothetical protein
MKASGRQLGILFSRIVARNGLSAVWRVYMPDYEVCDRKVATHFK